MLGPKTLDFHVRWVTVCRPCLPRSTQLGPMAIRSAMPYSEWLTPGWSTFYTPLAIWEDGPLWAWLRSQKSSRMKPLRPSRSHTAQEWLQLLPGTCMRSHSHQSDIPGAWQNVVGSCLSRGECQTLGLSWQGGLWRWFLSHLSFLLLLVVELNQLSVTVEPSVYHRQEVQMGASCVWFRRGKEGSHSSGFSLWKSETPSVTCWWNPARGGWSACEVSWHPRPGSS